LNNHFKRNMEEDYGTSSDPSKPIQKKILHSGRGEVPRFKHGTKVKFHFVAKRLDSDRTLLDDSRKWEKPMELIFGKKFKLESWELSLETMRINEVSSFITKKIYTHSYPIVAKTLRDTYNTKKSGHNGAHKVGGHMCAMMTMQAEGGLGYDDLNLLMREPEDLEFIMELLSVEQPEDYEKEAWQMDADEKLHSIPQLKDEGNRLFRSNQLAAATDQYGDAIGRLEQLMLREKPQEKEWIDLLEMKIPLLLNFSQCKLIAKDYYPVIEHCSEVLEHYPDNVKALFRRAKGHVGVWNPQEAKADFERVAVLDPSLATTCEKEIRAVEELEKKKNEEDKKKLTKLFS